MRIYEERKLALEDETGSFELTLLEVAEPTHAVLFAVGAGGDPQRHLPLLTALAERGCHVVAPHAERLVGPPPGVKYLELGARRLQAALDLVARPDLPGLFLRIRKSRQ